MHVLVTGGSGFIGSHLVEYLIECTQHDVTVLDDFSTGRRSNLDHIATERLHVQHGDVRDIETVNECAEKADEIYHLAAAVGVKKIIENPLDSLCTNLTGTENVLGAASRDGTPVFIASSSEVYGKPKDEPLSEDGDRIIGPTSVPRWGYATAKAVDEFLGLAYHDEENLPTVIGRFFNVVGPRQSGQYGMVVPRFVEQAVAEDPITVYGDGTQSRSFGHVEDTVEIVHELMHTPEAVGEVFNVGATEPTAINDLAERVVELTSSSSEIAHIPFEEVYGPNFEEPNQRVPDVTKLEDTIGRIPDGDLDRILTDVIEEIAPDKQVSVDV